MPNNAIADLKAEIANLFVKLEEALAENDRLKEELAKYTEKPSDPEPTPLPSPDPQPPETKPVEMPPSAGSVTVSATIYIKSGQVFDGKNQIYKAKNLDRMFIFNGVKDVVFKNVKIDADSSVKDCLHILNCQNITIDNVEFISGGGSGIKIIGWKDINRKIWIKNVKSKQLDKYTVWADSIDGLRLENVTVTVGSKWETSVRITNNVKNVVIKNCYLVNNLNKKTSLRLHDATGVTIEGGYIEGQFWLGPMSGGDGGERFGWKEVSKDNWRPCKPGEKDYRDVPYDEALKQRREMLALRTSNVVINNLKVLGSFGPNAGLLDCIWTGGEITAVNGGAALGGVDWSYPSKKWELPGDIKRTSPVGTFVDVKFTVPGRDQINYGTMGPFKGKNCTLNDKDISW